MTATTDAVRHELPVPCKTRRRKKTPERAHLHHCFSAWAQHPELEDRYAALTAAMRGHELKERLRRLLPPLTETLGA